ncbi:MAG: hypothetical protein HYZ28_29165, partial [Myxococcales bacterium]|nr:hypothetical protein [Myxococcales bacterium]
PAPKVLLLEQVYLPPAVQAAEPAEDVALGAAPEELAFRSRKGWYWLLPVASVAAGISGALVSTEVDSKPALVASTAMDEEPPTQEQEAIPEPLAMLPKPEEPAAGPTAEPSAHRAPPEGSSRRSAKARPPVRLEPPSPAKAGRIAPLLRRAEARFHRSDCRGALPLYRKASKLAPSSAEPWYGLALCSHELRRDAQADRSLKRALLLEPGHPMGNILAGFLAQQAGRYGTARAYYERYLVIDPEGRNAEELQAVLDQLPPASN